MQSLIKGIYCRIFKKNVKWFRTITQLTIGQSCLLIVGLILSKILLSKILRKIYIKIMSMGFVFSHIYESNNHSIRDGNINIVTITQLADLTDFKVCLRRMTTDFGIFNQIFIKQIYNPIVKMASRHNHEVKYIFDVGANIGCATIYFKKFFPDAKIIAIEPEVGNYEILLRNIKLNLFDGIIPLKKGLWSNNFNLEVKPGRGIYRECGFWLEPAEINNNPDVQYVEGINLNQVISNYEIPRIDILKVDIQGAERFLFKDERASRETLKLVKFLSLEVHNEFIDKLKIIYFLDKFNFTHFEFDGLLFAHKN